MVFLTALCAIRAPPPDRFWKRQYTKRLTWHFFGRRRNCYRLSQGYMWRALRFSTRQKEKKDVYVDQLCEQRVAAGCAEHNVQYSPFVSTLKQNNIELNTKTLADLAIYEPRTFQSLCELVKRKNAEVFNKNLNPSRRIFTKGML